MSTQRRKGNVRGAGRSVWAPLTSFVTDRGLWKEFLEMGIFAALTSVCHGLAYQLTLSSYVEAVKQVEVLFAQGIGWLVFGEAERARGSLWGCLVILAGAALINLPG